MIKPCTKCGNPIACQADQIEACWCAAYPALDLPEESADCLCPRCLRDALQPQLAKAVQALKSGQQRMTLPPFSGKSQKLLEGIDYYLENGRWVFTEWFHLRKGYCCGNGCRHCPYRK